MKAIKIQSKKYINGQTDGMNMYSVSNNQKECKVYASSAKDAILKAKAGLTISYL